MFPVWEGSIQTLFSTTAQLLCQLLKKWKLQLHGRTYQRRQVWPWLSLPKLLPCHILSPKLYSCDDTKLELSLLTLVKTGKLLAHMATAVCRQHHQAQGAAWLIRCLPMAFTVLDVFCGLSPDPWTWTESVRYCLPVFNNYHLLPRLFFCIVGQPQWLVFLNSFRNKVRVREVC